MLFRYPAKVKYQGFPYVIFTDPEYAHVGINENQAREQGYKKIEIFKFDFKDLDSAIINNTTTGMIKVVTSKDKNFRRDDLRATCKQFNCGVGAGD